MLVSSSDKLSSFKFSRQLNQNTGEWVLHKIKSLPTAHPLEQLIRLADDKSGDEIFTGLQLQDGTIYNADLLIYAIGIKPCDELELTKAAGIECHPQGRGFC